jgi:hypothetical protein
MPRHKPRGVTAATESNAKLPRGHGAKALGSASLVLSLLFAGVAAALPGDCDSGASFGVCVRVIDTAPAGLLDSMREVFAENACAPVAGEVDGIRFRTTEEGLAMIQQRLSWEGVNFLWIGREGLAVCDVELVALSPSGAAPPVAVTTPRPPPRRPAMPGSQLPELLLNYESREEALPDLLLLIERFDYLGADDRVTALNAMQTMYFDWRLLQARQFIERVALGDKRHEVQPEVGALAMKLITMMDGD